MIENRPKISEQEYCALFGFYNEQIIWFLMAAAAAAETASHLITLRLLNKLIKTIKILHFFYGYFYEGDKLNLRHD